MRPLELPGGLMVSQDGYTLDLITRQLPASAKASVELRILGPDGMPVTEYATEHGKELHLITARRDLTGFQHVHPQRDGSGTWSVTLNAAVPGAYRVFADFRPADQEDGLTLGSDLAVAGAYDPRPFPQDSRVSTVDDYTVDLQGELTPGTDSKLTLIVTKAGAPVTDLDPYLEAYGHLVALRDGDLAYLHVHPGGTPGDGSTPAGTVHRVLRQRAQPGSLSAVPRLQPWRRGPHRRVHRDLGRRCGRPVRVRITGGDHGPLDRSQQQSADRDPGAVGCRIQGSRR